MPGFWYVLIFEEPKTAQCYVGDLDHTIKSASWGMNTLERTETQHYNIRHAEAFGACVQLRANMQVPHHASHEKKAQE